MQPRRSLVNGSGFNKAILRVRRKKPQIKAPRVTPLEGVYTYCFAIRGRGVENPQGFGMMNADILLFWK